MCSVHVSLTDVPATVTGWTFQGSSTNPSLADCLAAFRTIPAQSETNLTDASHSVYTSGSCGITFTGDRPMGLQDFATVAAYLITNYTSADRQHTGGSAAGTSVAQQSDNTGLSVKVDSYTPPGERGLADDVGPDVW